MQDSIKSYRDLNVWKKTKELAVFVYKLTDTFPKTEIYGLVSQMRRAAVSMPSNIAEGFRRKSKSEKLQFLRIAYGSGAELETQAEISRDLRFLTDSDYEKLVNELDSAMKMLNRAISVLGD